MANMPTRNTYGSGGTLTPVHPGSSCATGSVKHRGLRPGVRLSVMWQVPDFIYLFVLSGHHFCSSISEVLPNHCGVLESFNRVFPNHSL
ncbi:hypothetical protein T01_8071 [Trichinella spiralis]|uniref:Uncharacterized protein n=1 Tax=Trichinella spiralis TaxID=6334 RepID=A0A0V1AKB9_TRISP|nr:hypothetical protein T01_8071 [Trichinella spiralis]